MEYLARDWAAELPHDEGLVDPAGRNRRSLGRRAGWTNSSSATTPPRRAGAATTAHARLIAKLNRKQGGQPETWVTSRHKFRKTKVDRMCDKMTGLGIWTEAIFVKTIRT
jgi:hypothetical protein